MHTCFTPSKQSTDAKQMMCKNETILEVITKKIHVELLIQDSYIIIKNIITCSDSSEYYK